MSENTLQDRLLQTAHESGAEMIIQLKDHDCEAYKGRIMDLTACDFTLFHSGTEGGILWAFKRDDIAFCGLVVETPNTPLIHNERLSIQ